MLLSNQPPMLAEQEFQNQHCDMLAAARLGLTVDPNAPQRISAIDITNAALQQFKKWSFWTDLPPVPVGSNLRIRVPKDFASTDDRDSWLNA